MSNRNDVERRLRMMASEPAPPADVAFADQLEVRLRLLHVEELAAARSRSTWIPALMGAVALAVLAVGGALLLGRTPEPSVVLTAAADTDVILPGAEATAASVGLRLPDGTRVVVGPDGEAVVNGVVLGPGSEAMVVGDQVDVLIAMVNGGDPTDSAGSEHLVVEEDRLGGDQSPTETAPVDGRPTPSIARDSDQPVVTDEREMGHEADDREATTTTTRVQSSSSSSTATVEPTVTSPPRPTSTTTTPTSTTSDEKPPSPLELTVERVDRDRLRLDWKLNRDVNPAGWRIRVEHGDRAATVVAIRDGDARMTTIESSVLAGGGVWVEALDREGQVLLASDPVEIEGR